MEKDLFKNRLSEILSIKNIKPSELSRKTGISKPLISSWLNGKYEAKQDNLFTLSQFFNINPAWLMGFDVPMENIDKDDYIRNEKISDIDFYNYVNEKLKVTKMNESDKDKIREVLNNIINKKEK